MVTNKEIMKNWQLQKNTCYGRIYKALEDARADEGARFKKLVELWEQIIALDDKHWDNNSWEKYSKEWDTIKGKAKVEIRKIKKVNKKRL